MRFAFIADGEGRFPVRLLCRVLRSRGSAYYAWCGRPVADHTAEDQRLASQDRAPSTPRASGVTAAPRARASCGRAANGPGASAWRG